MLNKREKVKSVLYETGIVILGAVLFSVAVNMFLLPANIVLGGMTGISTVLNIFLGTPVGLMIIILNIPLVILNTYFFGTGFLRRTVIGIVTTSVATDILLFFPVTTTDPLICAILGGVAMGGGIGLMMTRGYTTGGTDLIACLIKLKLKNVSIGNVITVADITIIIGASLFTKDYNGIFYSLLCTWAAGRVLDFVISGSRRAGQAFIITDKPEGIVKLIFERLDRGATVLAATGAYTGESKNVVMCVVAKKELFFLKQIVAECDPQAFVVIADAAEVSGEGFHTHAVGESKPRNKAN
ncbi:MAG: YitT family protein [Clostridia bacterium]|nr:YitT family protein [Clostridia bacterium]